MLTPTRKNLPQSRLELAFSVTPQEAQPWIEQAVADITTSRPLPGFRPGKASFADVKRAYGEMAILEAALERIVRAVYVKALVAEKIEPVGSPEIAVQKLAPGENIEFTATVSVMPTTTALVDYTKPSVTPKSRTIAEKDVDTALEELRKMRRDEVATDNGAAKDGMALVDMGMTKDKVAVEGGDAKDYRVYLGEEHYLPGFTEKLAGIKKGETRTFALPFPADHYNKALAGQEVEFTVTAKDVYDLVLPALDDAFGKSLGADSLAELRAKLKDNLQAEADQKTDEAAEIELLEKLVDGSKFTDVPENLLNEEVLRMLRELQHGVESQGGRFEDYLSNLKKTRDDLKLEFIPQAMRRIQTAVLIKEVAKKEAVEVEEAEVDQDVDRILAQVPKGDQETRARIISPEYRDYIAAQIRNRKVIALLKEKGYKK